MATLLERRTSDGTAQQIAADDRGEPRQRAAFQVEHLAIGSKRGERRRQPESHAGTAHQHAERPTEIELHEAAGGQAARPPVGEHVAQPAGLEDGEMHAHPALFGFIDRVGHRVVVEVVEVAVGLRGSVRPGPAEDRRARIDERDP